MIDPATLLAELAAIQKNVATMAKMMYAGHGIDEPDIAAQTSMRIGLLMSSIAAPPPVDNGMLAPIRARLDELERRLGDVDVIVDNLTSKTRNIMDRLWGHSVQIAALEGREQ